MTSIECDYAEIGDFYFVQIYYLNHLTNIQDPPYGLFT